MIKNCEIIIFFLIFSSFAKTKISTNVIFKASFGDKSGRIGTSISDSPDPNTNYPRSVYLHDKYLYIADCYNERYQKIDLINKQIEIIEDTYSKKRFYPSCGSMVYVNRIGNIITNFGCCYNKKEQNWKHLDTLLGLKILMEYNKCVLGISTKNAFVYDSLCNTLVSLNESFLHDSILRIHNDVYYLVNKKAIISYNFILMPIYMKQQYEEITGKQPTIEFEFFKMPDSTILHNLDGSSIGYADLIGYDTSYSSYWLTNVQIEKNKFRYVIIVFNKIGQQLIWFFEPEPKKGWFYGLPLAISKEGHILRMNYNDSLGIEIVQYNFRIEK